MKTSIILISFLNLSYCFGLPSSISPAHTSPTSAVKQTGLTSADQESHANPPIQSLPATTQYKGYHTTVRTDKNEISLEEYDQFFQLVDNFLWDSSDEKGRMYRRGYMRMTRPQFLMRRNGYQQEPSAVYRSFVDTCYDFACWSGLNSVVNSVMRLG